MVDNPHIQALTWENLQWMFTSFAMANWHPLTWLSHAIDFALFGLNPWGHHLTSLVIHCLNTSLFFLLALVLLTLNQSCRAAGQWTTLTALTTVNYRTGLTASIAALLFGIHPQHVESVVWIAERKDVLFLLLVLLTLLSYLFYTLTTKRKWLWYGLALFSFMLALLSKPMAVTVPIILILLDIYPLHRTALTIPNHSISYQQLLWEKLPFLALTLISIILTMLAQQSAHAIANLEQLSLSMRLFNAFNSIIWYISKFIFPIQLAPFYPFPDYDSLASILIPLLAVILITFVASYGWQRKQYYWLIGWLFYLFTLMPVLGLIQVGSQAAADRYAYLPTLPFYLLISTGVVSLFYSEHFSSLPKLAKTIKLAIIACGILITGMLLTATQKQTLVWRDDVTLWTYTVSRTPNSVIPREQLAHAYFRAGDYQAAIDHYGLIKDLKPSVYANIALAYLHLGSLSAALATYQYIESQHLETGQDKSIVYYNLFSTRSDRPS
ncbi:MAG: hypothetical protein BWK78_09350 [Thiotrichaceae bacterium IS1]|nr:MAG: hypothetical protein BWK78_09350 [Thiotrichaceae bacterium IS1]